MNRLIIFSLLALLCLVSCGKDGMPAPSRSGKHYLAFRKDGKVYVCGGTPSFMYPFGLTVRFYNDSIWGKKVLIKARDKIQENDRIFSVSLLVRVQEIEEGVKYFTGSRDYGYTEKRGFAGEIEYMTDTNKSYVLFTKITDKFVAGQFKLVATSTNGLTVDLKDGIFDIRR